MISNAATHPADSFCSSELCHPIVSSPGSLGIELSYHLSSIHVEVVTHLGLKIPYVPVDYHHSSLLTLLSTAEYPPINIQQSVGHWVSSPLSHSNSPHGYLFVGSTSIHQYPKGAMVQSTVRSLDQYYMKCTYFQHSYTSSVSVL